ncbi:ribbon-helix-helix domain-containing protein [Filomicrobium sp.]|uniref:ribbon-helix-helix domain-containing protein n=1 Tax=Filomicrobium sp. TaxID=2024831 RepID=UPI00258EAFCC|nr:ribbon-helix-helix domain-containing protein [Filomicrobium sp.]MCV0371681.1 ribbon-helix-helix domain-containing protein [Filomicrobium sp.]
MSKSTTVISQKKRGPKPTGKGTPVMVRLQPDYLAALDKLAEAIEGSRPEALRYALSTYMESDGFIPHQPRIGRNLLVNLTARELAALTEAVGPEFSVQQKAVEGQVRDWLHSKGYLKESE